ncbi:hypothetical protein GW796_10315 [archaeon]|nr:hypothetical protein [archaeon]
MSTRSSISILKTDGTIESVFCHWDGYIECVGVKLVINYSNSEKVKELISFGSIDSLQKEIHPKGVHTGDNKEPNVTVFYGREYGEINSVPHKFKDINEFIKSNEFQGFDYVYQEKNKKWYLFHSGKLTFSPLIGLIKKEKNFSGELKLEFDNFLKETKIKNECNLLQKHLPIASENVKVKIKI